jgi:hypothetical protein
MHASTLKAFLWTSFVSLITYAALPTEMRTWTFTQDGEMKTSAGGIVSFRKQGRLDARFVRLESTNAILLAVPGEYLTIPLVDLFDLDRAYIARTTGNDNSAAGTAQTAIVRNEMSRRRVEAAKVREDAADRLRWAQNDLDEATQLDSDAARLSGKVDHFARLAQSETDSERAQTPGEGSQASQIDLSKAKAHIASSAAEQLRQDIEKMRRQAQEKRQKGEALQREAAHLEEIARALTSSPEPIPVNMHSSATTVGLRLQ